ncbi:hypothetical protein BHE74_00002968 [Ensete ventricosum]|nr:hypothetical protein BHE74_00002968 [Ensete ventricosum]
MAAVAAARNHLLNYLRYRSFSSASAILNPSDPSAVLTSKQKSRAALALLKSETDPSHIFHLSAAATTPISDHICTNINLMPFCTEMLSFIRDMLWYQRDQKHMVLGLIFIVSSLIKVRITEDFFV